MYSDSSSKSEILNKQFQSVFTKKITTVTPRLFGDKYPSIGNLSITGMILSNKEKTGKLCNTKSGRHAHVEDMSRARRSRCAFLGGFGGMPPQEIFCFQHGFLDF